MKRGELIEKLKRACNNAGLSVKLLDEDQFPLELDSIEFITLVVEIENEFDIEWADELLDINMFKSLDDICNLVHKTIEIQ